MFSVLAGFALSPGAASAAAPGELCGTYKSTGVTGGYEVATNVWNSHGEICINTDGGPNFQVSRSTLAPGNATNPGLGPGGYPYIGTTEADRRLPVPVSDLGDTATSWRTNAPDSGTYNVAYDLWYMPNREGCTSVIGSAGSTEVMIWLKSPNLKAGGQLFQQGVVIDGTTYDVYGFTGPFGQTALIYAMTSPTSSVEDLRLQPITQDAIERGKISRSGVLCKVQAGFEIHDQAPAGLGTEAFSLQVKRGETTAGPAAEAKPAAAPTGYVTSGITGKCLDDRYNRREDGNPIISYHCNYTDAQRWVIKDDGTVVHAAQKDKCLTAGDDGKIILWTCTGSESQKWKAGTDGSLVGRSGRCLDVPGALPDDGLQLQLHDCNGTDAQRWKPPVTATPDGVDSSAIFSDAFAGADRLLTNSYANWNPADPQAARSPNWELTTGTMFIRHGVGWSGVPDATEPDVDSRSAT
ncbi:MAG: ricin-type beta-trefoil lectin domain protein, partial [Streptosporangiaceae bacterium]